jgi:hypothetical protein
VYIQKRPATDRVALGGVERQEELRGLAVAHGVEWVVERGGTEIGYAGTPPPEVGSSAYAVNPVY